MNGSIFNLNGQRKYLVSNERVAFVRKALSVIDETTTLCLALALTGARISELLAVSETRIDFGNSAIVIETLKRRKRGIYRAVPIPRWFLRLLTRVHRLDGSNPSRRLWPWCRTKAWKIVKARMLEAGVPKHLAMPRAARHAFGVHAIQNGVPLNLLKRWIGHARIESTAIYADAIGKEERALASRTWLVLGKLVVSRRF
jgi:integrase